MEKPNYRYPIDSIIDYEKSKKAEEGCNNFVRVVLPTLKELYPNMLGNYMFLGNNVVIFGLVDSETADVFPWSSAANLADLIEKELKPEVEKHFTYFSMHTDVSEAIFHELKRVYAFDVKGGRVKKLKPTANLH